MDERRFENDNDLYRILKELGRYGNLKGFGLNFNGYRDL